ncbi:pentatricopeptide repeat-containing protein At4g30700 [Cryptomeria japonica]|uniref:pentatricopeptide repeat-containing protein At4g30700 n=1 Tax=Cryptomeria japonica TaxID=3369 RepID=UPI0027D9DAAD|nr:pentatricopeptide repeat-containing protein At4g30700 [Cryptomeria japonica]
MGHRGSEKVAASEKRDHWLENGCWRRRPDKRLAEGCWLKTKKRWLEGWMVGLATRSMVCCSPYPAEVPLASANSHASRVDQREATLQTQKVTDEYQLRIHGSKSICAKFSVCDNHKMPLPFSCTTHLNLAASCREGQLKEALHFLFTTYNPPEDYSTYLQLLQTCILKNALSQGKNVHSFTIHRQFEFAKRPTFHHKLMYMYVKCGSLVDARKVFDHMKERDSVSWNTIIAAYRRHGFPHEAVTMFHRMQETGYAQNGFCKDALKIFELMKHSGTHPDVISFACVLFACSHGGLVNEGCIYFNHLSNPYCITPTIGHFVCMVDLLSRAGYLEDTLRFIIKMPVKPVVVVWVCFLGACRSHMNIGLGVFTAMLLFDLDPKNTATYVLLSNMYAEVGRWGEVQMLRRLMKDKGIKKIPGCSWIEGHKMVHAFCVGDKSHPQTKEIYAELEKLAWEMKVAGYFPDSRHLLSDVEHEEKKLFFCYHSEKLAIAFGLLNTPSGTTIRVVKNLRICADCHTATKFISQIVGREIVVRDVHRFHHFKQGECSCGDYW